MAYIGNTASTRFVANRAASVYSGDGSTVAFTLEEAVGSDEDILVSVDGVIQEPSVGYAVSSGTTLTFTAAPSNNSGNNIFVYYLSLAKGSIVHPSNVGLTATTGVFSSTAQATVLKGTTSLQSPLIEFTDGDDAIAIADAGIITIKNTSSVVQGEGSATTIIAQGLSKCWVNFNGEGTIAARDSFNMTSLTDNGSGDYTTTFANDFGNANYVFLGNSMDINGRAHVTGASNDTAYATGSMRGITAYVSGTNGEDTANDGDIINRAYFGDLA
jgi:hypothetical protein